MDLAAALAECDKWQIEVAQLRAENARLRVENAKLRTACLQKRCTKSDGKDVVVDCGDASDSAGEISVTNNNNSTGSQFSVSDTRLCVRNLARGTTADELEGHISAAGYHSGTAIQSLSVKRRGGVAFVDFYHHHHAVAARDALNQSLLNKRVLKVDFSQIPVSSTPEGAGAGAGVGISPDFGDGVTRSDGSLVVGYSRKGVVVGKTEFTFPQPKYLLFLIKLLHANLNTNANANTCVAANTHAADSISVPRQIDRIAQKSGYGQLLSLVSKLRAKQAKEISEIFGAAAAIRTAIDAAPDLSFGDLCKGANGNVHVYVPGDGRRPYTAAAVVLTTPPCWHVWSIDPLMKECFVADSGGASDRLTCVAATSQDFDIPVPSCPVSLSVVLAVHSHCPLSEFVSRVPTPRIVISLPCCGRCGLIEDAPPLVVYSDPDILSPCHLTVR